jgi:hypothetical protein
VMGRETRRMARRHRIRGNERKGRQAGERSDIVAAIRCRVLDRGERFRGEARLCGPPCGSGRIGVVTSDKEQPVRLRLFRKTPLPSSVREGPEAVAIIEAFPSMGRTEGSLSSSLKIDGTEVYYESAGRTDVSREIFFLTLRRV